MNTDPHDSMTMVFLGKTLTCDSPPSHSDLVGYFDFNNADGTLRVQLHHQIKEGSHNFQAFIRVYTPDRNHSVMGNSNFRMPTQEEAIQAATDNLYRQLRDETDWARRILQRYLDMQAVLACVDPPKE